MRMYALLKIVPARAARTGRAGVPGLLIETFRVPASQPVYYFSNAFPHAPDWMLELSRARGFGFDCAEKLAKPEFLARISSQAGIFSVRDRGRCAAARARASFAREQPPRREGIHPIPPRGGVGEGGVGRHRHSAPARRPPLREWVGRGGERGVAD